MKKSFCDICEQETDRNYAEVQLRLKKGRVIVQIQAGIDEVFGQGDVCKKCLLEAVSKGRETKGGK